MAVLRSKVSVHGVTESSLGIKMGNQFVTTYTGYHLRLENIITFAYVNFAVISLRDYFRSLNESMIDIFKL